MDKKEEKKEVKTDADKIWDEIKNKELSLFSLPSKPVSDYCNPVAIEPSKLYLLSTAPAFLPALEELLGSKFKVELTDKYTTVSRVG